MLNKENFYINIIFIVYNFSINNKKLKFKLYFRIWLQVLDRRQQRLELVVLSIDNFIEDDSSTIINSSQNSTFVPPQVIYSQTSNVWVNVSNNKIIKYL